MEFRLTYKGSLPSQSVGASRIREKHAIRRQIHAQLRELWHTNIVLERHTRQTQHTRKLIVPDLRSDESDVTTGLDFILRDHSKFGYRFVPLINEKIGIACSLDILFLRRDGPGNLVAGGDIDNRIKVLFDGLRLPQNEGEIGKFSPQEGENPFFCLLEDDKLITDVRITTDRLLTPKEGTESPHEVQLVIHVVTKIVDPQKAWPDFVF